MSCRWLWAFVLVGLLTTAATPALESVPRVLVRDAVVQGERDMKLRWPIGVASAHAGEIVVVDASNSRAIAFRYEDEQWKGAVAVTLPATPVGIDHDGNRYMVAMRGGQGLAALEGEGLQRRSIALPGGAVPTLVAARPGGGFLIYDALGHQVIALDANGTPGAGIPVKSGATALAVSPSGGFFLAYAGSSEIVQYDARGSELETLSVPGVDPVPAWPVWIRAATGGEIEVLDGHGSRVAVLDRSGRLVGAAARAGWEPGLLRFPADAATLEDGRLAIADTGNGRVQLFRRSTEDGP